MQLIYAALLLHSAGQEVNEENLKKIVKAVGEKESDAQVKALVAALEGVDIAKAIEKAALPVAAAAPAAAPAEGKKEEKKKKEDTEKKAEEAAAGLGALFG